MLDLLRWLLKSQRKHFKLDRVSGGFTLIELLVAMIIAFLIITPLFGFMLNIVSNDRKEQAKATSEQEIQSVLDYIAQDLKQAVYIYDADGLNNNSTDTSPGIKNQIPPVAGIPECQSTTPTCVPVLVFWKRELREDVLPSGDDAFVYSLVAYYLIEGNNSTETWSNAARIARFQITDGVGTANRDNGFQSFDLTVTGTTLKAKMNRWQKRSGANENYTKNVETLVDFIDQSTNGITPPPDCSANLVPLPKRQLVPSTLAGGFYACVNSSTTSAEVFIRGNALARIENNNATYNNNISTYFPTASVQIKGRGLVGFE